ncbi:MAG: rRNA maturation RNase YbeY [Parcubacteria group bacterium]
MPRHILKINDRVGTRVPVRLLEQVLRATLARYGKQFANRSTETSLALISDRSMANLNRMYRGKRGTTNVLSFSFVRPPNKIGAGEPLLLGEILISPVQATQGAKQKKHTMAAELAALFLHGFLHVLAFDHEQGIPSKKVMRQAEEAVIAKIPPLKRALKGRGLLVRELVYPK